VLRLHDTTPLVISRIVVTAITLVVLMPWLLDAIEQFAVVAWGIPPSGL
jgi:flagellar biosynthesis protein FliQ